MHFSDAKQAGGPICGCVTGAGLDLPGPVFFFFFFFRGNGFLHEDPGNPRDWDKDRDSDRDQIVTEVQNKIKPEPRTTNVTETVPMRPSCPTSPCRPAEPCRSKAWQHRVVN